MSALSPESQRAINRLLALPESEIGRDLVERVIALVPSELEGPDTILADIGVGRAYELRWAMTDDDADADAALTAFRRLADQPLTRVMAQATIGKILGHRYERTRNPAHLDEAVESLTDALARTPPGTAAYAGRTLNLARSLIQGAHDDVIRDDGARQEFGDRAIAQLRRAIEATSEADPNYAPLTIQLGDVLLRAYEAGWTADDAEALDLLNKSATRLPNGTERATAVQRIAVAGLRRAVRLRSLAELRRTLPRLHETANREPSPANKNNLAAAETLRAEIEQDASALYRAEAILADVLDDTPDTTASRSFALVNHAGVLQQIADSTGDPTLLERAAAELREAIGWAAGANEAETLAKALVNLGLALISRGRLGDSTEDLSAALQYLRSARQHRPDPHTEAMIAARMGTALLLRYRLAGDMADLTVAARELEVARAATLTDTPMPAQLRADLATVSAFAAAAAADGPAALAAEQLDEAISQLRELLSDVGPYGPGSWSTARSLAEVLLLKYRLTEDVQLLADADRLLDGQLQHVASRASQPSSAEEALGLGIHLTEQYRAGGAACRSRRGHRSVSRWCGVVFSTRRGREPPDEPGYRAAAPFQAGRRPRRSGRRGRGRHAGRGCRSQARCVPRLPACESRQCPPHQV